MDSSDFVVVDGIADESAQYLTLAKSPDLNLPVSELRKLTAAPIAQDVDGWMFKGTSVEMDVPCDTDYSVPVTVITPGHPESTWNNILVYFHGGGWVWGSRHTHMVFCQSIAQHCQCVVINVEYRLAPEHKYPACYEDGKSVVKWCIDYRKLLSGKLDVKVGVAGDSAGGSIAASVCHMLKDYDIAYQVLIYPSTTLNYSSCPDQFPSQKKYGCGYVLTSELMTWFENQWLRSEADRTDVMGSPLLREDHSGLPPALFIVAEYDPLADQSFEYMKKLRAAGIPCRMALFKETLHGFVKHSGLFQRTINKCLDVMKLFIDDVLLTSPCSE